MKVNKKIIMILCLVLGLATVFLIYKLSLTSSSQNNLTKLENKISSLSNKEYELKDITPFEWDVVYSFEAYIPKDEIEKTIGFDSNLIKETVSEGMQQVIFVKSNQVVCYVYGYDDKLGYSFDFGDDWNEYVKLESKDQNYFQILQSNGIKHIRYEKK